MAKQDKELMDKLWRKDLSGEDTWRIIGEYSIIGEIKEVDDANLILAAVNACITLNPDNPLAVAETIGDMAEELNFVASFPSVMGHFKPEIQAKIKQTLAKIKGGN
jgi:hypothetical protein